MVLGLGKLLPTQSNISDEIDIDQIEYSLQQPYDDYDNLEQDVDSDIGNSSDSSDTKMR